MFARCTHPGPGTQSRGDKQLMNEQNPKNHHIIHRYLCLDFVSPHLSFPPLFSAITQLRVHGLISNSLHKLLPLPDPNGLIQSQSPSHSSAQSPNFTLPFPQHMQTLSHHSSFQNPHHTFTLRFLLTPLTTQTCCGMHNSLHAQTGDRCPAPGCFPRTTIPTPQIYLSPSRLCLQQGQLLLPGAEGKSQALTETQPGWSTSWVLEEGTISSI